jgi:hypothetical protein
MYPLAIQEKEEKKNHLSMRDKVEARKANKEGKKK